MCGSTLVLQNSYLRGGGRTVTPNILPVDGVRGGGQGAVYLQSNGIKNQVRSRVGGRAVVDGTLG